MNLLMMKKELSDCKTERGNKNAFGSPLQNAKPVSSCGRWRRLALADRHAKNFSLLTDNKKSPIRLDQGFFVGCGGWI